MVEGREFDKEGFERDLTIFGRLSCHNLAFLSMEMPKI